MPRSFLTRLSNRWTKNSLGDEPVLDTGSGSLVMTVGDDAPMHSRVVIISGPESVALRLLDYGDLPEKVLLLHRDLARIATGEEPDSVRIDYSNGALFQLAKLARSTREALLNPDQS